MTGSSFLREMQSHVSTDPVRVAVLVKTATGGDVESVRRVVNGYDNEVYRVTVVNRGQVYVRIGRHGEGNFDGEAWAMAQAREAGVPVPDVLAIDRIVADDAERDAMVVKAAAGLAFETVEDRLSTRQRAAVLHDLGRVLGRLHAVRMPGMWRPGVDGRWPSPSELGPYFIRDRLSERDDLITAGVDDLELDQIFRIVNEFPGELPVEPVLCHGDVNRGHVFIDAELHVTCLIDWGMWHAWSPLGELAYVWKTFGGAGLVAVLEGSGAGSMTNPSFRRALAVSLIQQQVGHIAHHVRIGDEAGINRNVLVLRRALTEVF